MASAGGAVGLTVGDGGAATAGADPAWGTAAGMRTSWRERATGRRFTGHGARDSAILPRAVRSGRVAPPGVAPVERPAPPLLPVSRDPLFVWQSTLYDF